MTTTIIYPVPITTIRTLPSTTRCPWASIHAPDREDKQTNDTGTPSGIKYTHQEIANMTNSHTAHSNYLKPASTGDDVFMAVFMRRAAAPAIGAHGHRSGITPFE